MCAVQWTQWLVWDTPTVEWWCCLVIKEHERICTEINFGSQCGKRQALFGQRKRRLGKIGGILLYLTRRMVMQHSQNRARWSKPKAVSHPHSHGFLPLWIYLPPRVRWGREDQTQELRLNFQKYTYWRADVLKTTRWARNVSIIMTALQKWSTKYFYSYKIFNNTLHAIQWFVHNVFFSYIIFLMLHHNNHTDYSFTADTRDFMSNKHF